MTKASSPANVRFNRVAAIAQMREHWVNRVDHAIAPILKPLHATIAAVRSGRQDVDTLVSTLPQLLVSAQDELLGILLDQGELVSRKFAEDAVDDLRSRYVPDFDDSDPAYAATVDNIIRSYLSDWLPGYVKIVVSSFTKASQTIQQKHAKGPTAYKDSGDDLSDVDPSSLEDDFAEMLDEFGLTMADVLTTTASNMGPLAGAQAFSDSAGFALIKEWTAEGDNHVRPSHMDADGQDQDLPDPFDVGSSRLMFPMDSTLGASVDELIGCRCVVMFYAA